MTDRTTDHFARPHPRTRRCIKIALDSAPCLKLSFITGADFDFSAAAKSATNRGVNTQGAVSSAIGHSWRLLDEKRRGTVVITVIVFV